MTDCMDFFFISCPICNKNIKIEIFPTYIEGYCLSHHEVNIMSDFSKQITYFPDYMIVLRIGKMYDLNVSNLSLFLQTKGSIHLDFVLDVYDENIHKRIKKLLMLL